MKTNILARHHFRRLLRPLALAAACCALCNCASFESPMVRHDYNGDGRISPYEYGQSNARYDLAYRQRADEYGRARLVTDHINNVGDGLYGLHRVAGLLRAF